MVRQFRARTMGSLALLATFAAAPVANAGLIYINSPLVSGSWTGGSVAQAKYRLSHANWDQSLDRGTGTSSGNFISNDLGNNRANSAKSWTFSFSHLPGEGFVFSMTDPASSSTSNLSWGSFESAPSGKTTSRINGSSPGAPFNALTLEARATRSGSSMNFADLRFTSPTLTLADGEFTSGTVTPWTRHAGDPNGVFSQRLVADTDLSRHQWTLSGSLRGERDTSAGGDETVRFVIGASNFEVQIQAVPGPGGVAFASVIGVMFLLRRARSSA